jgi:hypothetical protein
VAAALSINQNRTKTKGTTQIVSQSIKVYHTIGNEFGLPDLGCVELCDELSCVVGWPSQLGTILWLC